MKNIKKFILAWLIIITQSLLAENKDYVYLFNNYGKDVSVRLTWLPKRGSGFLYTQTEEFIVPKNNKFNDTLSDDDFNKNFKHKAPYSGYFLDEIQVIPAANTWGHTNFQVAVNTSTAIPSAILTPISKTMDFGRTAFEDGLPVAILNELDPYKSKNESLVHTLWDLSLTKNIDLISSRYIDSDFFVIDNNGKKSRIAGQKQIVLSQFRSKDDCKKYILKNDVNKLIEQ